jgi:endonuclease YncB( thermonuclease family)
MLRHFLRRCALVGLCLIPGGVLADPAGRITVIDADTWDVGGERVRLHGIDAPELDQTCERPDGTIWDCGAWATQEVRRRFDGSRAACVALDIDRYGRTVARCRVQGEDAGRMLVRAGWAFAFRRYSMDYDLDEKAAAVQGVGLHRARIESPAQFRAARRAAETAPTGACVIKGNISSGGSRIYHVPGQEHYDRTRISTNKGERWFCSESEARAAGWRRAKR